VWSLTIWDTLEIPIGLGGMQVNADPLVINLILHVAQQDECGNNTLAVTGPQCCCDLPVPDVVCTSYYSADGAWRHGDKKITIFDSWLTIRDPIGLAGIAEVLRLVGDSV